VVIKIFEKDMTIPLLMDLYGEVLSERKRELLDYYYNVDYSLSEISELTGITRQGIRESIKKSEAELRALDESLHLVERVQTLEAKIAAIQQQIHEICSAYADPTLRDKLNQIAEGITSLSI